MPRSVPLNFPFFFGIEKILPDVVFNISREARGTREQTPNTVEWGVDRVNAPQVWSTYNDRGENIVVGNVDTGVLYTHGASHNAARSQHAHGDGRAVRPGRQPRK